jgi:adenine-specific DNA-methyltransferase
MVVSKAETMIKDILQNNENLTSNTQTLEVLHTHFPQCFNKEGNFDIDKFKELVRTDVDVTHEGYDLNFLGKNYAKLLASVDTTTVIQPDTEHNAKPENANSQNLYISGDNLDGLKHLLKSYNGAVKCIYIDPPYNTGTDGFVYNDKFNYTNKELTNKLSISDEQAQKILDLTTKGRASHSAWLTFMYPRLLLARDLLKPDGVIFISIDDNEQANLKLLCDSIFGEENFVSDLIWKSGRTAASHFTNEHEYIITYAKSRESLPFFKFEGDDVISDRAIKKPGEKNPLSRIQFPKGIDFECENKIFPVEFGGTEPVKIIDGIFEAYDGKLRNDVTIEAAWSMKNMIEDWIKGEEVIDQKGQVVNRFFFKNNGVLQYEKSKGTLHPKSIINQYSTKNGTNALESLLGISGLFDFPKPPDLLKFIFETVTNKTDIILDFFSGSATTAQATMQLNSIDSGSRKFITIQLPEELNAQNAKQKMAFEFLKSINLPTTLDYIGIERIKRAANKIKAETGADIDYGFKHYTLIEPSADTLDKLEEFKADEMFTNNDTLSLFGKETVLETWLVKDGYGFGAKVQEVKLADYTAHLCGKHLYFIEAGIDENDMVALLDKYQQESAFSPENIVVFGYSFNFSQTEMLRKNLFVLKDSHKNLKANFDIRY